MVHTEPKYQGAIDEPVPFAGTPEEARVNFATHHFGYDGDDYSDGRCGLCDTKVWHQSASYPCGSDVPASPSVLYRRYGNPHDPARIRHFRQNSRKNLTTNKTRKSA